MDSGIPDWFVPGVAILFPLELIFALLVRKSSYDIAFTLCCLMGLQAAATFCVLTAAHSDDDWTAIAVIPIGIIVTILTLAGCIFAAVIVSGREQKRRNHYV